MMNRPAVALVCTWLAIQVGCSSSNETRLRVEVHYDASWRLTGFAIDAMGKHQVAPVQPELLVLVPDAWGGRSTALDVWGLRGTDRWAHGKLTLTPIVGKEVRGEIALARLPCGAWCQPGAKTCVGDGVATCQMRASDGCMEWSAPVACPSSLPYCSLGACLASCIDECAPGDVRCDGPNGLRICGQAATPGSCKVWLPATPCPSGTTCSNGACRSQCQSECSLGQTSCTGNGLVRCGDLNQDGCLEWGPVEACPNGTTCSAGQCSSQCTDECSTNQCAGSVFKTCGQFDLDPCRDLSQGIPCASTDPCQLASCDPQMGCILSPKQCNTPPPATCVDANTRRVYDITGVCRQGDCNYASHDQPCPNCPACDPCANVSCNVAPSVCFATPGTCQNGGCNYPYANGVDCTDGNDCTMNDRCMGGVCTGTPMSCSMAPGPVCADAGTVRIFLNPGTCAAGNCTYPHTDTTCPMPLACIGGACRLQPMPTARGGLAATLGSDGRIYVMGGGTPNTTNQTFATVEAYDPATNTWTPRADMPTSRYGLATVSVGDAIYAIGGFDFSSSGGLSTTEKYSVLGNNWTMSVGNLRRGRGGLGATYNLLFAANFYAVGGGTQDYFGPPTSAAEVFKINQSQWMILTNMPTARNWVAVASAPLSPSLYVIGGIDTTSARLKKVEAFNLMTGGAWTTLADMPTARMAAAAATSSSDGKIYVFGGIDTGDGLTTVEAYDSRDDTWVPRASMPTARWGLAAAEGPDHKIYVFGGWAGSGITPLTTVEAYDPSSNTWTR
jgi:N-acetylneuraminic acid mutarotase